ncbi:MAG TPA: AAA family ATPase [Candidatus Rubneribacter avistercoris]|nr:AAA family ATPase [Candidatus Rubneribacter avistercoris]
MLYRKAWDKLESWHKETKKKALMLSGARQIGKTTLVRAFAQKRYEHFAELNFLMDEGAASIFSKSIDADTITANLTAYLRTPLEPGKTLVLLDEIQECPRARTAIKSLVEDGRFDYVETGSLLGVRTKEVASYPVGFEEPFRMHPLDFEEFCLANGVQNQTIELLRSSFLSEKPVSDAVHETMMRLFAAYLVVGGMPEVVQRYVDTHDIAQMLGLQRDITALYRQDIAKYATGGDKAKIQDIFDAIPSQLDDKNRRFVLADLAKTARQNRYESSFLWLADAGVALPCYNVNAPTTPLAANAKRSLFKLFMGDVGLLCASSLGNVQFDILQGNLEVNMGSIVENAVAQELVAHGFNLHYFNSKRQGEVDFVAQQGKRVIPIEVKSGNDWQRHRALSNVLDVKEWGIEHAYVLSKGNVAREGRVTYLPLYMTMFLEQERLPEGMRYEVDLSALG